MRPPERFPVITPLELALIKAIQLVVDQLPHGLCMARECRRPAVILDRNDRVVGPKVLELCSRHAKAQLALRDLSFVPADLMAGVDPDDMAP